MKLKQKPLENQVIVITGASSGIGRVTAEMAAAKGATVVVSARSRGAIEEIVSDIKSKGGEATVIAADVKSEEDMNRLAAETVQTYGRIDTWVNNAGVSIYAKVEDIQGADAKELFETNLWGTFNGSRAAIKHMKQMGGTLINVGSTLSDRAIPIQGIYSASKHAVKGLTDALRMELEHDNVPIQVTLIKPAAIDTPYTKHVKNYMPKEAQVPSPVYDPELVAEAILHCATHKRRDMFVGGIGGKGIAVLGKNAARLTDKYMEATMFEQQQGVYPAGREVEGLYSATGGGNVRGYNKSNVRKTSLYTQMQTRPAIGNTLIGLSLGAVGLGLGLLLSRPKKESYQETEREFVPLPEWRYKSEFRDEQEREPEVEAIITEEKRVATLEP
jgi:short-subunit dehydrogenase